MNDHLRIAPFHGLRYGAKVPEIDRVVAPPYDMISPAEQEELHARDPYNIVRLILAKDAGDDGYADRYDRAAAAYRGWREEGVLARDEEPSIYAYEQEYQWDGSSYRRLGFIARVALAEFGKGAFPHESTLSGPKADRLRLMTACQANFSPIFSLFSDSEGRVLDRLQAETASTPLTEFTDPVGTVHRLWQLSRSEFHDWINMQMYNKQFIIADGHHRYETALEYRRFMREEKGELRSDLDYVMMFLAPIESPGLTVLPFHRLVTLPGPREVPGILQEAFESSEHPLPEAKGEISGTVKSLLAETPSDRPAFLYYGGGNTLTRLVMRKGYDPSGLYRPGTSAQVGQLDVTVLHQAVIGGILGHDEPRLIAEGKISYQARAEEAVERVRSVDNLGAFLLRPTRIDQVWDIAVSGQRMPQKSTNFYPKLITGLVLNEL